MSALSPWCHHPPGITRHSAAQHAVCQQRQDAGQLAACGCTDHGGHDEKKGDQCRTST